MHYKLLAKGVWHKMTRYDIIMQLFRKSNMKLYFTLILLSRSLFQSEITMCRTLSEQPPSFHGNNKCYKNWYFMRFSTYLVYIYIWISYLYVSNSIFYYLTRWYYLHGLYKHGIGTNVRRHLNLRKLDINATKLI